MSENVLVALIGGVFSLLTAIVTIVLQRRIGRERSSRPLPSSPDAAIPRPSGRQSSAAHITTAVFVSALILVGVALIKFVIQTTSALDRNFADVLLMSGAAAFVLLFAWGDSIFPLVARQTAIQLKILALYAGIKIALILEYRQDCLSGVQMRDWFCSNLGLPFYFDFLVSGWTFWALMAVIGGLAVEMIRRMRGLLD